MEQAKTDHIMYIQTFVYLQTLDFLTTIIGLGCGANEASPFIRLLMTWEPALGVLLSKLGAVTLGGICIWRKKYHIIRWVTYWYAGLIIWNLCIILRLASRV